MLGLQESEVLDVLDAATAAGVSVELLESMLDRRLGESAALVPIGQRDAAFVDLRVASFGPQLDARATCPSCEAEFETSIDLTIFDQPARPSADSPRQAMVEVDGIQVTVRLPTRLDIEWAQTQPDPAHALIERCMPTSDPAPAGDGAGAGEWSAETIQHIEAAIEAADPLIEIQFSYSCAECGEQFTRRFDICDHLTNDVLSYGRRLMSEIHVLASRYGWTEPEILALPPRRRRSYLDLVH